MKQIKLSEKVEEHNILFEMMDFKNTDTQEIKSYKISVWELKYKNKSVYGESSKQEYFWTDKEGINKLEWWSKMSKNKGVDK